VRTMRTLMTSVVLMLAAVALAPVSSAGIAVGNYSAIIEGRYDFHTYTLAFSPCNYPSAATYDCYTVSNIPMPIARAYAWYADAHLVNGRWTLAVDVPEGLRCGNVYYGPVIPTHDVYSWDAVTLTGTVESTFDVGCDNEPGGTNIYPLTLVRL